MGHPPAEEALSSLFVQGAANTARKLCSDTQLVHRPTWQKSRENFPATLPVLTDPATRKAITLVNHKASISREKAKTEKFFPIQPDGSQEEADTIHSSMDPGAVTFS